MVLSPSNSSSVASRCWRAGCPLLLDATYGPVIWCTYNRGRVVRGKRNLKENRKVAYNL